ncbi:MAG TPA: hypothetical protein VI864_08830 [Candidatus Bathyarchaeia archaeon]|nr:hypothetical protein [Candidatus Bathyarchaeia archaeon]
MTNLLKFLEDGAWHTLPELAQKTGHTLEELVRYCETLTKHGIIQYDPTTNTVRLRQEPKNLITQLHAEEKAEPNWKKPGVATIIIPPEKSFHIQKVTIHNMTKQDLQFELKFDKKLKEIAITQA